MGAFDSDSSGGEDNDYTETNVLLGYASKEASDDTISHLGGYPEWLDSQTPPTAAFAKCLTCHDLMVLLLQLNGDLPDIFPGHERRLYVFTCRRKTCRRKEGSVRTLRAVKISDSFTKDDKQDAKKHKLDSSLAKSSVNLGESLFGTKQSTSNSPNPFSLGNHASSNPFSTTIAEPPSNPFSSNGTSTIPSSVDGSAHDSTATNLHKTFAETLSINNENSKIGPPPPPEPWPPNSDLPSAYPTYYLADADYEMLDKIQESPLPTQTLDLEDGGASGSQKEDKDVYESTIDKTFQKFADRLAQNPEQVIRYEFKGHPLLYSRNDTVGKLLTTNHGASQKIKVHSGSGIGIPRCGNCGADRVFEVQLTPHAIMELESEESSLDGMEWGTIIVGVCEKDCQQKGLSQGVGYIEEWTGVQWEETK